MVVRIIKLKTPIILLTLVIRILITYSEYNYRDNGKHDYTNGTNDDNNNNDNTNNHNKYNSNNESNHDNNKNDNSDN